MAIGRGVPSQMAFQAGDTSSSLHEATRSVTAPSGWDVWLGFPNSSGVPTTQLGEERQCEAKAVFTLGINNDWIISEL